MKRGGDSAKRGLFADSLEPLDMLRAAVKAYKGKDRAEAHRVITTVWIKPY